MFVARHGVLNNTQRKHCIIVSVYWPLHRNGVHVYQPLPSINNLFSLSHYVTMYIIFIINWNGSCLAICSHV
jgi:hypothetical protein